MRVKLLDQKRVLAGLICSTHKEHATTLKDKKQLDPEIQIFRNALDFSKVKAMSVWFREMKLWQWTLVRVLTS